MYVLILYNIHTCRKNNADGLLVKKKKPKKPCTWMFTAALLIIAKTWKEPNVLQ